MAQSAAGASRHTCAMIRATSSRIPCAASSIFRQPGFEKKYKQGMAEIFLPGKVGEKKWRLAVFNLARALQGLGFHDSSDPALAEVVSRWHGDLAGCQTALAELVGELFSCWDQVRNPDGKDFAAIWRKEDSRPLPAQAVWFRGDEHYEALIRGCRNLAAYYRGKAFPLSCRVAARALGVNHIKANRMLTALKGAGILRLVKKGSQEKLAADSKKKTASTWLYVGE